VGGGINVGLLSEGVTDDNSTLTLTGSILDYNVAQGGNGSNGGDGLGGGLAVQAGASATVSTSVIMLNQAIGGQGGAGGIDGQGMGGGVYHSGLGTLAFDILTFIRKNHASTSNDDVFGTVTPV
jgi:hypothetical protein